MTDPFYKDFTDQLKAWQDDQAVGQQGALIFSIQTSGCRMPLWLREQHPLAMAIVFEHRVWDLDIRDDEFEFVVTFNKQPCTIIVPYPYLRAIEDKNNPGHPYQRRSTPPANDTQGEVVSLAAWRKQHGR